MTRGILICLRIFLCLLNCLVFAFWIDAAAAHAVDVDSSKIDIVWTDPRILEPLPGRASAEQLRHLPRFVFSPNTCMPAPVIDQEFRLSAGLPHTREVDGDCLPIGRANIYTQTLIIAEHTALAYALYFPKDGAAPFGVGGHRHDWEYVIVWTKNAMVTAVTFHQHNGWYTQPRDRIAMLAEHPVVYVGRAKHGLYHRQHDGPGDIWSGICYFCDDRVNGETWYAPDSLVDVDQLPASAVELLQQKLWGKANSPFRHDVFPQDAAAVTSGELCRGLGCLCGKPSDYCPAFP